MNSESLKSHHCLRERMRMLARQHLELAKQVTAPMAVVLRNRAARLQEASRTWVSSK